MKRKISTIGILIAFLVLCGLFLGCPNGTEQSTNTIKVTVQNNSGYKLYSVKAGGVEIGDIEIGTSQRKDIEPDELSYSVFFTIKATSGNINIKTVETKVYTTNVTIIIEDNTMVVSTSGNQTGKTLSQYISDIETGNINYDDLTNGNLPEGTLAHKLNYIASQSVNDVLYDIVIDNDIVFGSLSDPEIATRGRNVVVHIHSENENDIKTISVPTVDPAVIFLIENSNITLKLSNIVIKGTTNAIWPLLYVAGGATLVIEDGTLITGNNAAGVQVFSGGKVIMNGGEISDNQSTETDAGAGIGLKSSSFIMNGGIITRNEARVGGGIYFERESTILINGGVISGNTADGGGGLYGINNSTLVMNGGKVSNNTATKSGGGVALQNASFTLYDGEISDNIGSENAGGIFIVEGDFTMNSVFTMNGGVIKGNSGGDTGGGIYALDRSLTINGGGSRINVSITGGEIIGNSAKTGGGIALYNSRFTKTGGYIAGTDAGINANISTKNEGDAIVYCRDYTFWDRKLSLTQSDNISTDNLDNGWTYLGDEGSF